MAGRLTARAGGGARQRDRGQSLVEFVLVLPILLVMIFGIIEFANAWRTAQLLTNTAREVARQAILPNAVYGDVRDTANSRLTSAGLDVSKANILVGMCTTSGLSCSGRPDTVRISYPYRFQFFGPVLELMCGSGCGSRFGTINLSSTAIMRNE